MQEDQQLKKASINIDDYYESVKSSNKDEAKSKLTILRDKLDSYIEEVQNTTIDNSENKETT